MTKPTLPTSSTTIKYTNSKSDIWKAYKEILKQLSQKPATPSNINHISQQVSKANLNFKQQLLNSAHGLNSSLESFIEKISDDLDKAQKVLAQLAEYKVTQEQQLLREKEAVLKQRKREAEEYDYDFNKRKQRQEDELSDIKTKTLMELNSEKLELKAQQSELKELREKVSTFDQTTAKIVKNAVEAEANKLKTDFSHQKALLEQKFKASQDLAEQKIKSLEGLVRLQEQELKRLQNTQVQTQEQLTEIAQQAVTTQKAVVIPTSVRKKERSEGEN